ncbi:MAG: hypothetical protein CVU14_09230, partial [Bacteroidetes bacterium HGW-Bacteroidetes-9]
CGNGPATALPVTVFLLPTSAGTITGDILFCEGTTHTYSVTAVSGVTYLWTVPAGWSINSGQGTNSIDVTSGINSGLVGVTPQNACGDGPTSTLSITVNPLPAAATGPDGAICVGATLQIGAPAISGNTYSWTSVPVGFTSTEANPEVSPGETTTYTLVETNTSTGCSNSNSVTILANQIISVTATPLAQSICTGGTTNIVISSNISGTVFTWNPYLNGGSSTSGFSSGSGSAINQTIINASGLDAEVIYDITATADECSNNELSVSITIHPAPAINNQAPAAICSDVESGIILGSSTNGVAAATYNITSINNNGLSASAGNPITGTGFNANEIANDAWTNTTTAPVNVIYTVQGVSSNGCVGNSFTVTLTINPKPTITNASAVSICSGLSPNITLSATIACNFTWTIGTITGGITGASAGSGPNINQTLTNPSNSTAGSVEYVVTPTSSAGNCPGASFTITVTVNPVPVITNNPNPRICSGSNTNLALTSTAPSSFSWTVGTITGGITGASAGSGSSINQILTNPSNATSGTVQYIVTSTATTGGCTSSPFTITVSVDPIPSVSASANPMSACPGVPFNLTSSSSLTWAPSVLLTENFNGATNTWLKTNSSTGGTPGNAAWTLRPDGYTLGGNTFHSNDNSQFYLSNSDAQGSGSTTRTYLRSPAMNTTGYSSLSLDFYHFYRHYSNSTGYVQVSTDNTNWTTVQTYVSDDGGHSNFTHQTIDLSAYVGNATFYVRFYYYAQWGWYWAIDNVTVRGTSGSTIPIINWSSNPAGFSSTNPNPSNLTQAQTTAYTVSYTNPLSGCTANSSVTVTTLPTPNAAIIADFCAVPGYIQLTATGGVSYLWSTGQTAQVILVDIAGQYSVTVTGANGCTATASLSVSTELVVNGNFSAGNTAFTSGYTYDPTPNGLIAPESEYAIYPDARITHTNFWGYDHTSGTGTGNANFMIVNGAKYSPQPTVWQQTVTVVPNTDYYFSAWAISLNNVAPYAKLRFEVNGVQVGTTANLTAGVNNNNNPWLPKDRFYGSWNSGASTTAVIRIIDLETAAGGNDFGLDDISFGTLSPIPFTFSPSAQGGTNLACEGENLQLNANITGGMEPYIVSWTGPNGFTSTQQNPIIPNVTLAAMGTYQVTVYDSYGCTPQTRTLDIRINPAPTATVTGGGGYCQFAGSPFIWFTAVGGTPPFTFEYNLDGGPTQTITTFGISTSAFIFAPTNITGSFTYNLTSVTDDNGCTRAISSSTTVVVNALPSAYITGDWVVCPGSDNVYTGNSGMENYDWSVSGNGSIPVASNLQNINVTAGDLCSQPLSLLLMVTDGNGCNATAEELV